METKHTSPSAAKKPAKVISSIGVNAAYLQPGESCVSIDHSFCALITLSNGRETFVTHQASADHYLMPELQKIAKAMGGKVKVRLYQNNYQHWGFADMLTQTFGEENIADMREGHGKGNSGSFLVEANGSIAKLGNKTSPAFLRAQQELAIPDSSFKEMHQQQPITSLQLAPTYLGMSTARSTSLCYGDLPSIFTGPKHGFTLRTGETVNYDHRTKDWNQEVRNAENIPYEGKKAHIIGDVGVNTTYLEPGESCVSYRHGFCALIVISDGKHSFVTHQARPNFENLHSELMKIKKMMGPKYRVDIYQQDFGNKDADKAAKIHLKTLMSTINSAFFSTQQGVPSQPIYKHTGSLGSYLITADGSVRTLGLDDDPRYRKACATYGQDFGEEYCTQRIVANHTHKGEDERSVFNYGTYPTFARISNQQFDRSQITTEDLGPSAHRWNLEVQATLQRQQREARHAQAAANAFPTGFLIEDQLRMDEPDDNEARIASYEASHRPATAITGQKTSQNRLDNGPSNETAR